MALTPAQLSMLLEGIDWRAPERTWRPRPGLLAHVLVSKYADHLPLYRQSQIFDREGLDLDSATLADAIGRHALSCDATFADDTPVSMLAPGTGKTQNARLWTYARDERPWGGNTPLAAWYRFSGDRKGQQHPKYHLARFRGWMHADGYGTGLLLPSGVRCVSDGVDAPRRHRCAKVAGVEAPLLRGASTPSVTSKQTPC